MRLLADTHVVFWSMMKRDDLSPRARSALEDDRNEVLVSVATAWEIAVKVGLGKWPEAEHLLARFEVYIDAAGFGLLPVNVPHVRFAGLMKTSHKDPFDRLLAAQACLDKLTLVSADAKVRELVPDSLW